LYSLAAQYATDYKAFLITVVETCGSSFLSPFEFSHFPQAQQSKGLIFIGASLVLLYSLSMAPVTNLGFKQGALIKGKPQYS
jgi:hypothetical protein